MTDPLAAIRTAFDERAAIYDEHHAVAEAAAKFAVLDSVRDVLDIATGTGLALRAIRTRWAKRSFSQSFVTITRAFGSEMGQCFVPGQLVKALWQSLAEPFHRQHVHRDQFPIVK